MSTDPRPFRLAVSPRSVPVDDRDTMPTTRVPHTVGSSVARPEAAAFSRPRTVASGHPLTPMFNIAVCDLCVRSGPDGVRTREFWRTILERRSVDDYHGSDGRVRRSDCGTRRRIRWHHASTIPAARLSCHLERRLADSGTALRTGATVWGHSPRSVPTGPTVVEFVRGVGHGRDGESILSFGNDRFPAPFVCGEC